MSDHLPECPAPHCDYGEPNGECYGYEDCWHRCCCPELRACEQRVLLSKPNIELSAVYGYEAGRSDGLNAARDAVAAVPIITIGLCDKRRALAAIDNLITKNSGENNGRS